MAICEKNCWMQRTPLETGLILILIVTVPFLITMIITYTILLTQGCPQCSLRCSEHCARRTSNLSLLSMFLPLHPNISLPKLAEKYEICPDSMLKHFEQKVDYAFVASVIKDVYVDDIIYQRYLCAAAIITFKWVVSSSKCFEYKNQTNNAEVNRLFVRAGSKYWLKGGSVHAVTQVIFADKTFPSTVAAIKLETGFPRLSTIRPIMLSTRSLYKNFGIAESYFWESNDTLPLHFRKKHVKLDSEPNVIFKDVQCKIKSHDQAHVFCSLAIKPKNVSCMLNKGFPVTRTTILLGISIGGFCDFKTNNTVYLIYDISKSIKWLEKITGVYVENF